MSNKMDVHSHLYQSYLLRMWKENESGDWRAVLLSIPTQERRLFSNLQALFEFLDQQADLTRDHSHYPVLGNINKMDLNP